MINKTTITLPQGARDILPDEARRVAGVQSGVLAVFESSGFSPVITPTIEFEEVLSLGLDSSLKDKILKFIDPNTGKLVGIRPDITPQIARLAATSLKDSPRPLKLSYNQSVIRYRNAGGGGATEIMQLGAEYLSDAPGADIDAELIATAIDSLKAIGLKGFKIDIGDVGFVKKLLSRLPEDGNARATVREAIAKKDDSGLRIALDSFTEPVEAGDRELLLALTTFYGEEEVLKKAAAYPGADVEVLDNLGKIVEILTEKGYHQYITIDLGEVRGFDYYTGIIIEGFAPGVGRPILYGGRYDNLAGLYGRPGASSGFAFDVERLLEAIS